MIDLHSHILPGIDDGARTLQDTVDLAEQSVEQGVTHIMCTPHIHTGVFDNTESSIRDAFTHALNAIKERHIPLRLSYSCEVRICSQIPSWIQAKALPFLGRLEGMDLLLLELPHSHIPPGTENLIKWLKNQNIRAVIPHPERNRDILADYKKAKWLKKQGVLFQVTAGALVGTFSEKVKATAWKMLDDQLIDYVASDMHSIDKRPNQMAEACYAIALAKGKDEAMKICVDLPASICEETQWH